MKSGRYEEVTKEIQEINSTIKNVNPQAILKVIIECCLLSESEKKEATKCVVNSGAEFVKTSTGFAVSETGNGAKVEDVKLMLEIIKGTNTKIKAAGGIKSLQSALQFISLGVHRIGTSSGIQICENKVSDSNY